jgi:membrane complex biogenesis BtpA family protein
VPPAIARLIGVVHVAPLPGAPRRDAADGRSFVDRAVRDARAYAGAGFDGVLVENYGDAPWFKDRVPAETCAALAVVAAAVRDAVPRGVRVGVNVLRNDARTAVAVAAAAGLDFVRVNVLAGAAVTDQGIVEGDAANVLRDRARLVPRLRILADVRVKHATPLGPRRIEDEVKDLLGRGGADALVVTGSRTGEPVDLDLLAAVRAAASRAAVLVGSGATARTVRELLRTADGVIVGTAVERGGTTGNAVDPGRARAFARAARGA